MKKILSFILSICILMMSGTYSVFASDIDSNEVILSVNDAAWTLPDGLGTLSMVSYGEGIPCVAAVGADNAELTTEQLDKNIYVTYSNIPQGVYKVEYFYPNSNDSNATGRNAQILDNDIIVTDANGTHEINSTKPSVTYSGWVDIGTYEFGGSQNSIKVTVNQDNKYFKGQWSRYFCSSQVKLIPVTEDHSALLTAVNAAADKAALKRAVIDNANGFVNISALKYMDDVYDKVLQEKPESGFSSVYAFKDVFEKAVDRALTKKSINSSSFVWQTTTSAVTSSGYRINWAPVELGTGDGARAIVTFKLDDVQNLQSMSLKLNLADGNTFSNPAKISKYSSSAITLPSANKIQDKTMMADAAFTELTESIPVGVSDKEISNREVISAAKSTGYISFYIEPDTIQYAGYTPSTKFDLTAQLQVKYDNTADPTMNITEASVNTKALNTAKVFDIAGFEKIASIAINGVELAADKYEIIDNRLRINGNVFNAAGNYTVSVSNGVESRSTSVDVASDTVLADSNREITVPAGANKKTLNASEWNIVGNTMDAYVYADTCNAENTYATYKNIPQGAYEVYYCTPSFKGASVPNKRNLSVLDNSISVKDKNGTTVTESVKTSVSGGGLVNLGTYEFDGINDEIKVYVNSEHICIEDGQYDKLFVPGGLVLKSAAESDLIDYYFKNGKTYLESVNSADTADELEKILKSNSFVDTDVINNISSVCAAMIKQDYQSVYAFKKAFNAEVEKNITTITYKASVLSQNVNDTIRPLTANQTLHGNYYLAATFKDVKQENVISAEIKLNTKKIKADAIADGYSYAKYDRPTNDSLTAANNHFNGAKTFVEGFKAFESPLAVSMADSVKIAPSLLENMTGDKYISFKFKLSGDILNEIGSNVANEYTSDVTLTICYDNSAFGKLDAAKAIADAATIEEAKKLTKEYGILLGLADDINTDATAVALWGENISSESEIDSLIIKAAEREILLSKSECSDDIVTVTVKNLSSEEKPIQVIAATYGQDNAMNGIVLDTDYRSLTGLSVQTYTLKIPTNEFKTMKIFAFDNLINIRPYDIPLSITK